MEKAEVISGRVLRASPYNRAGVGMAPIFWRIVFPRQGLGAACVWVYHYAKDVGDRQSTAYLQTVNHLSWAEENAMDTYLITIPML